VLSVKIFLNPCYKRQNLVKHKKRIFLFIILIVVLFINQTHIIDTKGNCIVKYNTDDDILNIRTTNTGQTFLRFNQKALRIFPNTEVDLIKDIDIDLKTGIILTDDDHIDNFDIDYKILFENQWGMCQFFKLKLPIVSDISSDVIIFYNNDDKTETIPTKLNFIYEKNDFKYYGFFIPYNPYWKTKSILIDINIYKENKIFIKLKKEEELKEKRWESQKIYFKKQKSKYLMTSDRNRYNAEQKIRRKIWDENNPTLFFKNGFNLPLSNNSYLSSEFGFVREWLLSNKKVYSKDVHLGVDYARDKGVPVYSSSDGIVRFARNTQYYGNMLIIEHGFSCYTDYAHLNRILVKEGQKVKKGQTIGTVGMSGSATGPHLHWGARVYGIPVDPRSFLSIEEIFTE